MRVIAMMVSCPGIHGRDIGLVVPPGQAAYQLPCQGLPDCRHLRRLPAGSPAQQPFMFICAGSARTERQLLFNSYRSELRIAGVRLVLNPPDRAEINRFFATEAEAPC